MKRVWWGIGIVLILAGVALGVIAGHQKPPADPFLAGEALVQFESTVTEERAAHLIAQAGATIKERIAPQGIYVVAFSKSIAPQQIIARFQQMPEVAHAEPNGLYEPMGGVDWWMASEAWAEETTGTLGAGAKVTVAVIDTAIDATHPALAGKVTTGYNVLDSTTNTQSSGIGQDWHGTASSGRVLDGAGDANVEIMPIQVFGTSGGATWSTIIKAINYAVDNGAQVINMSLGGMVGSPLVQQAIDRAVEKGIVVVASAGNHGTQQPAYPASMNGVISVAATNEGGRKASFSAYGSTVDISAPGDTMRLLSHGGYRTARGTSFSAPFITGMLAMLKSAFPFLTAAQCEEVMKARANDIDAKNPGLQGTLGAGLLNTLDVKAWMAEIRAGAFTFPWGAAPVPPIQPPPVLAPAPQPWLVRGRGHDGNYVVTPGGELVRE